MPDKRKHRGPHPLDHKIFDQESLLKLKKAMKDLNYLIDKDYSLNAALEIVGNRYQLVKRQRKALSLNICPNKIKLQRLARNKELTLCKGETIYIDGFNFLITLESILSGAFIFISAEKCIRDLSGVHGSYKLLTETEEAIELSGKLILQYGIEKTIWILDKPVSNSGRLKSFLENVAKKNKWNWEVQLEYNPDAILIEYGHNLVSHDSQVLDHCHSWINLPLAIMKHHNLKSNLVKIF